MVCTSLLTLTSVLFICIVIWTVIMDGLTMTIPNQAVLSLFCVVILAVALSAGTPMAGLADIGVGAVALAIGFALFARGIVGGGDAKLLAVLVIAAGTASVVPFLILAALIGGALAMVVYAANRASVLYPSPVWARCPAWVTQPKVPYGVAMGVAALIVIPDSRWNLAAWSCAGAFG